jgi:hypothetical protein
MNFTLTLNQNRSAESDAQTNPTLLAKSDISTPLILKHYPEPE